MNYILILHSIVRWAILLFGLWTVLNAIIGVASKRAYRSSDNRSNLLFMTFFDIQLLLGLVLYFGKNWFNLLKSDMKGAMGDSAIRFFTVEHALLMIIAWVMVHMGRVMVKRADGDAKKHRLSLVWFGIAFLLILLMVPWPFREAGIARPYFPQF
jgi:hypothetical protein